MAPRTFTLRTEYRQPLSEVFALLSRHETLASVFGIPVKTLVTSGDPSEPNGIGSVRSIHLGLVRFEETITGFERDRTITYRVTKGGFLKHHDAIMRFSEHAGGTRVEHTVEMASAIPGFSFFLVPVVELIMRFAFRRFARMH